MRKTSKKKTAFSKLPRHNSSKKDNKGSSKVVASPLASLGALTNVPWWTVSALTLPTALVLLMVAEADRISKQYNEMIIAIDRSPFYSHASGLLIAVSHQHSWLAKALFANHNFPSACVHAFYGMHTRQFTRRYVDRVLPQLHKVALPENGGLNLSVSEIVNRAISNAIAASIHPGNDRPLLSVNEMALMPCPIPQPRQPAYVLWGLVGGLGAVGVISLAEYPIKKGHWQVAAVAGTIVGVILSMMRHRKQRRNFEHVNELCAVVA